MPNALRTVDADHLPGKEAHPSSTVLQDHNGAIKTYTGTGHQAQTGQKGRSVQKLQTYNLGEMAKPSLTRCFVILYAGSN
jgi:hypothetical protein